MINETKLRIVLMKLKEKFDFDVDAVLKTVMEVAAVRKILSHEELAALVDATITNYMNEKAMKMVDPETFNKDVHQMAGAMAVGIAKHDKQTIKEAFLELSKDVELLQSLGIEQMARSR